ncbi:hypothetical protein N8257_03010 [Ulvibacter sp.]|jgi:hypothetical protein|nr:hypothetical protein [Ulvibacter sp.]|tara:strand:+ start:1399 stop:1833 length:435 start_codon:yes stop_codon:yes gene_type:complete
MKKLFLIILVSVGIISCKNKEEKQVENADTTTVVDEPVVIETAFSNKLKDQHRGDFLFMDDAAVLKGDTFIYGVTIDAMSKELAKRVESIKEDPFTMVPVFVKGTVKTKPIGADGWDEILTITEIINVSLIPAKEDIKIEEKKS